MSKLRNRVVAVVMGIGLAACGGSGSDRVANAPPPPSAPAPTPSPTPTADEVTFMSSPGTGTFTQVATGKLREIAYDPETKTYQVKIEDGEFYPLIATENSPSWYIIRPPGSPEWGTSIRNVTSEENFSYTALASYTTDDDHKHSLAFGHATPEPSMPKTGTGTYKGQISGEGTMTSTGWGILPYTPVAGGISIAVNFTDGTLSGLLDPRVDCDCDSPRFEDYSFTAILTGNGFKGSFDLGADPHNFINGIFTGPRAEEAMGLWSFSITLEGEYHWVSGAFAAGRSGN